MSNADHVTEKPSNLSEGIAQCAVSCPMCGLAQTQYRINPQLYWYTDMDVDRRPTGYKSRRSLEGYYPRLYELWHCPQCHYTAHNRVFPDPLKHVYIEKKVVGRKLAELRRTESVMEPIITTLGRDTSFEHITFEAAIRLSLLEIYFQQMIIGILNQGYDAVARNYLRLAWLFRDWHEMTTAEERKPEEERLAKALDAVLPLWPDCVTNENDALDKACAWFSNSLNRSAMSLAPVESCSMMMQMARIYVKMEKMDAAHAQLNECRQAIATDLDTLTRAMNEDLRTKKMSEEERGRMLTDSRKLSSMMEECRTLKDDLTSKKMEGERLRAKKIMVANPTVTGAALRALLQEAKIPLKLVNELAPEVKSSRFFGGLFGS